MRIIKTELKKILTSTGFYICIVFTVILCFSAQIYTDPIKDDQYSVFTALQSFDKDFMLTDTSFCSVNAVLKGAGGWLTMFMPIISAFSFIPLVCDEYETKSVRFEIFRCSRVRYHLSRFITACLCGGLAVMIGYAVFSALAFALLPDIGEYSAESRTVFLEMQGYSYPALLEENYFAVIAGKLGTIFLYGAVCAVPAITLTSFIRNKYLSMCIPFFLKYALGQTCLKLQSQAFSDMENMNEGLLKLSQTLNPDSLSYLGEIQSGRQAVLIYSGALVISALVVYLIIQLRRYDSGE